MKMRILCIILILSSIIVTEQAYGKTVEDHTIRDWLHRDLSFMKGSFCGCLLGQYPSETPLPEKVVECLEYNLKDYLPKKLSEKRDSVGQYHEEKVPTAEEIYYVFFEYNVCYNDYIGEAQRFVAGGYGITETDTNVIDQRIEEALVKTAFDVDYQLYCSCRRGENKTWCIELLRNNSEIERVIDEHTLRYVSKYLTFEDEIEFIDTHKLCELSGAQVGNGWTGIDKMHFFTYLTTAGSMYSYDGKSVDERTHEIDSELRDRIGTNDVSAVFLDIDYREPSESTEDEEIQVYKDAVAESKCLASEEWCEAEQKCVKSMLQCFWPGRISTPCTNGWPAHEGRKHEFINFDGSTIEKDYACDIFEVRNTQLTQEAKKAINCCVEGCSSGCHERCKQNRKDSLLDLGITDARVKTCAALYTIDSLGPTAELMQDYYYPELICTGFEGFNENEDLYKNWDCSHFDPFHSFSTYSILTSDSPEDLLYVHKYNQNTQQMKCDKNSGKTNSPGGWASDTDMSKNSCMFSNLPAHASAFKMSTGTCYDYASVLATLLRIIGYKEDEVYVVSDNRHTWNMIKIPDEKKWTFVDTTGNKQVPYIRKNTPPVGGIGGVLSPNFYCDSYKDPTCANDHGLGQYCPAKSKVWGCA